jgi:glycosyltransferase involved in cell wall biosynthesis
VLRNACRLAPHDVVVGFVGRVVEVKGVGDFLHMASALGARHPRCRFLIVGDDQRPSPNHRTQMEGLADRLGIAAACRFMGFRNDVWELLHLCDVVVMPSHAEPFGNVAVETAAAGRPLVAARVGGIPEIVRDGDTGVLVSPGDPRILADAVGQLVSDPERRAALGERARVDAAARFSLGAQARAVMDLYDELRAERRRT